MKDTSESFDQLVRSKLQEVEIDPLLADAYWQQMQLPVIKQTGAIKFRRYYWLGASVLLVMLIIFAVTKSGKNTAIDFNFKIMQQPKEATPISTNDTVTIRNEKQIAVSQTKAESQVIKKNDLNKLDSIEIIVANKQLQNKSTNDSVFNQTTATLNSLNQLKELDTARLTKGEPLQTGIQQANINLEKIDSLNKKPEAKKKAPHIIW